MLALVLTHLYVHTAAKLFNYCGSVCGLCQIDSAMPRLLLPLSFKHSDCYHWQSDVPLKTTICGALPQPPVLRIFQQDKSQSPEMGVTNPARP
jgi:hypothetical protein